MKNLLVWIDPIARKAGFYTSYELDEEEYIGDIPVSTDNVFKDSENLRPPFVMLNDVIDHLEYKAGYELPPKFVGIRLEAAKTHPETGDVHDVSLRKLDPEDNRRQWHIHLWYRREKDAMEVWSHKEYAPDFERLEDESYGDMIERLRTHYSPDWSTDEYQKGVACDDVQELV